MSEIAIGDKVQWSTARHPKGRTGIVRFVMPDKVWASVRADDNQHDTWLKLANLTKLAPLSACQGRG